MKQIRILAIVFTVLMLASLLIGLRIENGISFRRRDISEYNDLIYRMYEDYRAGKPTEELEQKYHCHIILSADFVNTDMTQYYADGALVLDVAPDGATEGKVAWDDRQETWQMQEKQLRKTLLIIWGTITAAGYLFLMVVYLVVVKPIREFEEFAGEVAKGHLDVQLPRRRLNLFGNFTESFDMMREELRNAQEREVKANKAKREMAAGLGHDIKTPVATIQAACEVLEAKYSGEKDIMDKMSVISARIETINQLVNNLFHSTLEELEELPVTPAETVSSRIESFFSGMNQKEDIVFDNHIPDCLVYIDPIRMEQAVDNVISNSRKYAGTDIHVFFDQVDGVSEENGGVSRFIRITVRDAGPGVPEEELGQITGKYFRGSNAAGQEGYGLGMYLVKWYMEKQSGGLEYYNDNGFVVELLVRKV